MKTAACGEAKPVWEINRPNLSGEKIEHRPRPQLPIFTRRDHHVRLEASLEGEGINQLGNLRLERGANVLVVFKLVTGDAEIELLTEHGRAFADDLSLSMPPLEIKGIDAPAA